MIYFTEGEKDADTLASRGHVAVCSPNGSNKAKLPNLGPLKGRRVVIVADNDMTKPITAKSRDLGDTYAFTVAGVLEDHQKATVSVVHAKVGKDAADHIAAGHSVQDFVPVGADTLDRVSAFMGQYLTLPSEHALTAITLWAAHTWATSSFYVTPRLILDSPEPGSGKTRVLELLALLGRDARITVSASPAALYRKIEAAGDDPPTILQDEADAVFNKAGDNDGLRAIYNSGYKRGATVERCEGDAKDMKVKDFPVFAPVALAGLAGKMPDTITSRAVTVHMRRRRPDEHVAEYRERRVIVESEPLKSVLEAWVVFESPRLAEAWPDMPEGVRDRPAEVWEALLAVADAAGGEWPERAREACRHFVLNETPKLSLGERLLFDIYDVFYAEDRIPDVPKGDTGLGDRMLTRDLLEALTRDEESEWFDFYGSPLKPRRLATELRKYGIEPKTIKTNAGFAGKGYIVGTDEGLGQAWAVYVTPRLEEIRKKGKKGNLAGQKVTEPDSVTKPDSTVTETETVVTDAVTDTGQAETTPEQGKLFLVTEVTDSTDKSGATPEVSETDRYTAELEAALEAGDEARFDYLIDRADRSDRLTGGGQIPVCPGCDRPVNTPGHNGTCPEPVCDTCHVIPGKPRCAACQHDTADMATA
ncbi:MAG: DUF3631 domain-containing protein [Gordonia amarae]